MAINDIINNYMEIKLPHINTNAPALTRLWVVNEHCVNANTQVVLEIEHDGHIFNTIDDDILYINGKRVYTVSLSELYVACCWNTTYRRDLSRFYIVKGNLHHIIYSNLNHETIDFMNGIKWAFNTLYIKKPTDDKINLVTKVEEVIKVVEKEKIIEKEVIKYKIEKELEECPICNENKAIISLSCCSIMYCSPCAMQIYKDKHECSQCRGYISIKNIKQFI